MIEGGALVPVTLLLLHEGGWDEVLMVALGLGAAYLIIMFTGRRSRDDDEDDDDEDEDADGAADGAGGDAARRDDAAARADARPDDRHRRAQ